jgi:predicted ribosome quality control (RQC) complex YloA/Tae2 family protein
MALGPEMICAESIEISRESLRSKVRGIESGDSWLALILPRDRIILLSWDAERYGACYATPEEVRILAGASSARPRIADAVKSHAVGCEIEEASAPGRDRVLWLKLRRAVGAGLYRTRYLLLEASGRYSNLLLLDEEQRIIEAAKHIYPEDNRYRSIIPGGRYSPPPPVRGIELGDWRASDGDALSSLQHLIGIGKPLIAAITAACGAQSENRADVLRGAGFFRTWSGSAVYQSIGEYVTLYPRVLPGAVALQTKTALGAARRAVVLPLISRHLDRTKKRICSRLDHLTSVNAKKVSENEALLEDNSSSRRLLDIGRLILSNKNSIPQRSSEAELTEWTESGEERIRVALDPKRDAVQNADRYFAKYKKRTAAAKRAAEILPSLYEERDELQEQATLLEHHDDPATIAMMLEELTPDLRRKQGGKNASRARPEAPHKKYEFNDANATIFCGLSAKGNRFVTLRLARGDDLWFHAQGIPGAHVILRFNSRPLDSDLERMLRAAASCAAYHSKGRDGGSVKVDYAERKYVRPVKGGAHANVTYKEFGTIQIDPSIWLRMRELFEARLEAPREGQ